MSNVKSPKHYKLEKLNLEVIDIRDAILSSLPKGIDYRAIDYWSRSWEYLTRMWNKNGIEDAEKALYYLERLIKNLKENNL